MSAVLDGDAVRHAAGLAPRRPPAWPPADEDAIEDVLVVVIAEHDAIGAEDSEATESGTGQGTVAGPVSYAARLPWALGPRPRDWARNPSTGPVLLIVGYYPTGDRTDGPGPAQAPSRAGGTPMPVIAGVARVDSTQWTPVDPPRPDGLDRWPVPVVEPLHDPTGGAAIGALLNLGYEIGYSRADAQWTTKL